MSAPLDLSRVLVIGMSASGKSTFAQSLARQLGSRWVELDELHWTPGWIERDRDDFRRLVDTATAGERWVTSGMNYGLTHELVWPRATLLVWLNPSFLMTLWQGSTRTLKRVALEIEASPGCLESWSQFYTTESIPWHILTNFHSWRARTAERVSAHKAAGFNAVELDSRRAGRAFLRDAC